MTENYSTDTANYSDTRHHLKWFISMHATIYQVNWAQNKNPVCLTFTKLHFLRRFPQNSRSIHVKGKETQKDAMFLSIIINSVACSVPAPLATLQTKDSGDLPGFLIRRMTVPEIALLMAPCTSWSSPLLILSFLLRRRNSMHAHMGMCHRSRRWIKKLRIGGGQCQ
jgi:hypothetical protein